MANPGNLKPFVKGDKRINRNGRPKSFDQLRKLAQRILSEAIEENDTYKITRIEKMLKSMADGRSSADRQTVLAYAYGKPKETVEVQQDAKVKVEIEYIEDPAPAPAREPEADQGDTQKVQCP